MLNKKLLNNTEIRNILKTSLVDGPHVTIAREDRTMVREVHSRPRTTALEVHTSIYARIMVSLSVFPR